jgi:hypothetical protein
MRIWAILMGVGAVVAMAILVDHYVEWNRT